jgi:3-phenylpropionate/cinnamic acid dioxygenase small subunit
VNIVAPVSSQAIEQFLYREARLADESLYEEWMSLWTEDAIYWIPANLDDYDPHHHISIIYDDHERLQSRIDRLVSGEAWAQEPKSRVRRLISNIENRGAAENGDVEVYSNFILGELRRGRQTSYFAQQVHRLRPSADGLRIAFKKVILINNNEPIHNLTFII